MATTAPAHDDSGMTLIEIIVTIVVGGLVFALIATSFANGTIAQRDGVARDAATGAANVVSASLTSSVRNAALVEVRPDGNRLDVLFIKADGDPECRAWEVLTDANGVNSLLYRSDSSGALPAADANWGQLATRIEGTLHNGAGDPAVFAELGNNSVQIGLTVAVRDAEDNDDVMIAITDGVTAQGVIAPGRELDCSP